MKTVKQLIEELSILNQDKPIWIYYDLAFAFEPDIDISNGDDYTESGEIKKDDYIMKVW